MSSTINQMNSWEKISLVVSVLVFLVAFVTLTLSDNVSDLIENADIVVIEDSIKLDGLAESNGYIHTLNLRNRGNAASKNINLIIDFKSEVPSFELDSEEDIGETELEGRRLKVRLDRLSINSSLKITMFSEFPILYHTTYIDDGGNHQITINRDTTQRSLIDMIMLLVIIVSLLTIVWVFRRASESILMDTLQSHQNEIQERLREVRDEIGNIEVVLKDPNGIDSSVPDDNVKGVAQRLAEFIKKT